MSFTLSIPRMVNSLQGLSFVRQKRPFVCHASRVFANRNKGCWEKPTQNASSQQLGYFAPASAQAPLNWKSTCVEFASSSGWMTTASKWDCHEKGSRADSDGFVSAEMTARKRSFFTILFAQCTHDTNGVRARKCKAKRCVWARNLSFGLPHYASWF